MVACGGKGYEELVFNRYKVSVWDGEKVLELDSSDGYTILLMYLLKATELYA